LEITSKLLLNGMIPPQARFRVRWYLWYIDN